MYSRAVKILAGVACQPDARARPLVHSSYGLGFVALHLRLAGNDGTEEKWKLPLHGDSFLKKGDPDIGPRSRYP